MTPNDPIEKAKAAANAAGAGAKAVFIDAAREARLKALAERMIVAAKMEAAADALPTYVNTTGTSIQVQDYEANGVRISLTDRGSVWFILGADERGLFVKDLKTGKLHRLCMMPEGETVFRPREENERYVAVLDPINQLRHDVFHALRDLEADLRRAIRGTPCMEEKARLDSTLDRLET